MTDVTVRSVAPRLAFSCPVAPAGRRLGLGSSRRNGSSGPAATHGHCGAVTQHESVQGPGAGSVTGSAAQSAAAAQVQLQVERWARAVAEAVAGQGRNKGDARSGIGTIPF